jgi:Domain of unknown function (DUF4278)
MKLYYRGQSYEYNPSQQIKQPFQPVSPSGRGYGLKYRGVSYHVDPNTQSAEVTLSPTAYKLIYRGVAYFINKTANKEVTIFSQPAIISSLETAFLK